MHFRFESAEFNKLEHICNHQKTLEDFSKIFGESAITPRLFESDELYKGSIVHDFMNVLDLPWQSHYKLPRNSNLTLSATGLELLRRVNEKIPVVVNDKPNPLRGRISNYFENNFTSGDKHKMPEILMKEYDEAFKCSNEQVREKWFPERKKLFKARDSWTESTLVMPDSELQNMANLIVKIWTSKQRPFKWASEALGHSRFVQTEQLFGIIKRFFMA
jgi:hypothetical protein